MTPLLAAFEDSRVLAYAILGPILILALIAFLYWPGSRKRRDSNEPPGSTQPESNEPPESTPPESNEPPESNDPFGGPS